MAAFLRIFLSTVIGCSGAERAEDMLYEPPAKVPRPDATVPAYGGTLAVGDGWIVAADPGRRHLYVRQADTQAAVHDLVLPEGAQPFRVEIDGDVAYVTFRGRGEVAMVDLAEGRLIEAVAVCAEPRGLEVTDEQVLVACASGELITLDHQLAEVDVWRLRPDLRDVVVSSGLTYVSVFRTAEVLQVDRVSRTVTWTHRPDPGPGRTATVAWRMRARSQGGVLLLHQSASDDDIHLDPVEEPLEEPEERDEPAYGQARPCENGLSESHFSMVLSSVSSRTSSRTAPPAAFDFDLRDGRILAATLGSDSLDVPSDAAIALELAEDEVFSRGCVAPSTVRVLGPASLPTSVAWNQGEPLAFAREPSRLVTAHERGWSLDGQPVRDGPFQVFHRQTEAGLACASCHPEGQDDGHVWRFATLGPRRTQNLAGGLAARAPFHWDGEFADLSELMADVFTDRMGGEALGPAQVEGLLRWLDGIEPVVTTPDVTVAEVERGAALFASSALGCLECHEGSQLTDHQLHDVGTRGLRKTPSLLGLGNRAPFMHDGCAASLRERLVDEACGGTAHGPTADLDEDEVDALMAYLQTL